MKVEIIGVHAVQTEFVPATASRGGHIRVTNVSTGKRLRMPYDHALDRMGNHEQAASQALGVAKMLRVMCKGERRWLFVMPRKGAIKL